MYKIIFWNISDATIICILHLYVTDHTHNAIYVIYYGPTPLLRIDWWVNGQQTVIL